MQVDIIGVPVGLGASRRGVDMGPAAIRYSGLHEAVLRMGLHCRDLGNIEVPVGDLPEDNPKARYKKAIADINRRLSDAVAESLAQGHRPVILGGDHSIAAGSILGTRRVYGKVGVIWMDAHGDFNNEETTLSGNLHGMSLAAVVGAGTRGMVDGFSPSESCVDPHKVAIVGTPVQGGLTYREAHLAAELIAGSPKLRTLDLVELNPILDHANQTGEPAVSLLCSLLGKRIFRGAGENA